MEYSRNCPDCGKKLTYANSKSYQEAIDNNGGCKQCAAARRNKSTYENRLATYGNHFEQHTGKWFRPCPKCGDKIYYSSFHSFNRSYNEYGNTNCRSCIATKNCNDPTFIATRRQHVYSKKGIVTRAKKKRKLRKLAAGLDPKKSYMERICPQCKTHVIKYKSEKSALQAEERGHICRSCADYNIHSVPGYTAKTMQNAMKASHMTCGVSKLEKKLIPILEGFGFQHTTKRTNIHIGKYSPDFVNDTDKVILEVYGDYWHCNPTRYPNGSRYFPQLKRTAQQQWDKDSARATFYRRQGYTFVAVWESDVRKYLKSIT